MMHRLLMALVLAAQLQAPAGQAPGTFRVSGTVVRDDKLDPASVAQANQVRIQGPMTVIVTIGAGGKFEFENVRPGNYQLVVGPRITMSPLAFTVTDKDITDLRAVVPLSNDITGTVIVDGNGLRPRFTLTFNRVDATANPVNAIVTNGFTVTLPQGQYRITTSGLPGGYNLKSITMGGADVLSQPVNFVPGASQPLAITLGVSSPPPWVQVRGRVTGGNATMVTLAGNAVGETLSAAVSPDRTFVFPMVLPGTYTARTLPALPAVPAIPVTIGSTNVADLEVAIPATKEVSGKVTMKGTLPVPPRLTLILAPVGASQTSAAISTSQGVLLTTVPGSVNVPLTVGSDGSFKVTLSEGERQLSLVPSSVPAGVAIESFTYGSTDVLKGPVRIAANDTSEIAITFDATGVAPRNVSGFVRNLLTTQGVRVVLQGGGLGTGVESPVAPDGSFSFKDIPPGSYTARLSLSGLVVTTPLRVDNRDVTDLIISHPRRFAVAAHVVVDGDTGAAPTPPVTLEARHTSGQVVTSAVISTSSGGPMQMQLSDGDHKISATSIPTGYALKSLRYGTTDLQESPLKVDGPITWEIIVRLVKTR